MSPRLYASHMRAAARRMEQEQRGRAWVAWHIEALARQKKMPEFQKFAVGRARRVERQTPEQMIAAGMALARAWGAKEIAA